VAITISCECGTEFQTSDDNAGRRARCPDCGRDLIIPPPGTPAEKPMAPHGAMEIAPAGEERTSGKAITSLVLGICSFFCCLFTGLPAVIVGILGLNDIRASHGRVKGEGMAITGMVLGILGCFASLILPALLLPAVQAAREAARRAQCTNNLRQIGLALHNYHAAYNAFPPAVIADKDGKPLLSWRVAILPYIERNDLYGQFHLDEPWDSPHNSALVAQMPVAFRCPSELRAGPGATSYQVYVGPDTLLDENHGVAINEVTDGTANTIAVVESATPVPWTKPDGLPYHKGQPVVRPGSMHPGGANALFADGSVRFLKQSLSEQTLRALITRDAGEVIAPD
jgi:prepilin-type processing-associated H-X9-DG protein